MKIRTGFVSNSSSSSFCVAKCFIPKEDLQEFKRIVDEYNDEDHCEGGHIDEDYHYFCGELEQSYDEDSITKFLKNKKIPYYEG